MYRILNLGELAQPCGQKHPASKDRTEIASGDSERNRDPITALGQLGEMGNEIGLDNWLRCAPKHAGKNAVRNDAKR
ncbi:hypothetical protein [Lysobacter sp. yr284]|uniref:hypothetical protein n=1 Tax=Lysobacter sp. yr284 TaxID=1761791 RepID=UPI0011140927|nr:hypothetical protein [Lysobacter sp. yr284]